MQVWTHDNRTRQSTNLSARWNSLDRPKKSSSSSSAALTKVIWILPSSIEMEPNRLKDVDNSAMSNSSPISFFSHQSQIVPIDEAITKKKKKKHK